MQQHLIKFKYHLREGKKVTKKVEIILCLAVSYTDAEVIANQFFEKNLGHDCVIESISKFQTHEILGFDTKYEKSWWKSRIKYVSEDNNGKIIIAYDRFLCYSDDLAGALKLIIERTKNAPMQGTIEQILSTSITYNLISNG